MRNYLNTPPSLLRQILQYDHKTGLLVWLPRDASLFNANGRSSAAAVAARWNTRNANKPALNSMHPTGYLRGHIFGDMVLTHRVVWAICYGQWPQQEIDHINRIRHDNRIENLRDVSRAENMANVNRHGSDPNSLVGINYNPKNKKYRVRIYRDNKDYDIGYFKTIEEARAAKLDALAADAQLQAPPPF